MSDIALKKSRLRDQRWVLEDSPVWGNIVRDLKEKRPENEESDRMDRKSSRFLYNLDQPPGSAFPPPRPPNIPIIPLVLPGPGDSGDAQNRFGLRTLKAAARKILASGLLHPQGIKGPKLGRGGGFQIYAVQDPETLIICLANLMATAREVRSLQDQGFLKEKVEKTMDNLFFSIERLLKMQAKMLAEWVQAERGLPPKEVLQALKTWHSKVIRCLLPKRIIRHWHRYLISCCMGVLKAHVPGASKPCRAKWTATLFGLVGVDLKTETIRR